MVAVSSAFATPSVSSVIPNFTAMKIGSGPSTPATGDIVASGTGTFTGNVRGANLISSGFVKTNTLVPNSTVISLLGTMNVTGDLISGGTISADHIGYYYSVSDSCDGDCDTIPDPTGAFGTNIHILPVSCSANDIALSCAGIGATSYSSDLRSCNNVSLDNLLNIRVLCFNPDGVIETSVGGGDSTDGYVGILDASVGGFSDIEIGTLLVEQESNYFDYLSTGLEEMDRSGIATECDALIGEFETTMAEMETTLADMQDTITSQAAEISTLQNAGYITNSALSGYATTSALTSAINSVSSSLSTLRTQVTSLLGGRGGGS